MSSEMGHLICELSSDDETFNAVQVILKALADAKKTIKLNVETERKLRTVERERDGLLNKIKTMESVLRVPHYEPMSPPRDYHRKRMKTKTPPDEDASLQDLTINEDDLNTALNESAFDEEEIAPTQQEVRAETHRSKNSSGSGSSSDERNKENKRVIPSRAMIQTVEEKSPTVLQRRPQIKKNPPKNQSKSESPSNSLNYVNEPLDSSGFVQVRRVISLPSNEGSPKWKTTKATPKITPRRLINDFGGKKSPSSPKQRSSAKRKLSLNPVSANPTSRMKQSTINFRPRNEDETYCEGVLTGLIAKTPKKVEEDIRIKVEKLDDSSKGPVASSSKIVEEEKVRPRILGNRDDDDKEDDSVVIVKETEDIVFIEESQSSENLFQKVLEAQKNLEEPSILNSLHEVTNFRQQNELKATTPRQSPDRKVGVGCKDCEEYHRMMGRDEQAKSKLKKFGVCSKHRRNVDYPETPEGFWNPTIPDTPEDERTDTPFESLDRNLYR